MSALRIAVTASSCLVALVTGWTPSPASEWVYRSPVPGSRLVSPGNTVVMRAAVALDPGAGVVSVVGAESGAHGGVTRLARDGRTIVFTPARRFAAGERVEVAASGFRTRAGLAMPTVRYDFTVSPVAPGVLPRPRRDALDGDVEPPTTAAAAGPRLPSPHAAPSVPEECPYFVVLVSDDPEPGAIFTTPNTPPSVGAWGNLFIADQDGNPLFFRKMPHRVIDFRLQADGRLSYFDEGTDRYYLMDAAFTVVDSFETGNGYVTDLHEFVVTPEGHGLLMAYDPQPVRMDTVVAGGNPNAIVTGLILQEIDQDKNVVFQWRSWDHFEITDAVECAVDLQGAQVDYAHGNSIDLDLDGDLLVSSRHMNEITKIDRETGAIVWRFGLNALNNQFTVVGDTRGFSHQHDARRLPNGHLTLYDNGNCLTPQYSRALEFQLDEVNKVATLVWEHREQPDVYGRATGNAQRRPSGSTMINWGLGAGQITDIRPDGSKALELRFGATSSTTYRARQYDWVTTRFATDRDTIDFGTVAVGNTATVPLEVENTSATPLTVTGILDGNPWTSVLGALPRTLAPGAAATWNVRYAPEHPHPLAARLYVHVSNDTELVARSVWMRSNGTATTDAATAEHAAFAIADAGPTPGAGPARIAYVVPRAARVRLRIADVQGRHVVTLADRDHAPGRHETTWSAEGAPPGLYFVTLEAPGARVSRKLVRLR
jgi:hypothetical protein